jgi:hypothetical protein
MNEGALFALGMVGVAFCMAASWMYPDQYDRIQRGEKSAQQAMKKARALLAVGVVHIAPGLVLLWIKAIGG